MKENCMPSFEKFLKYEREISSLDRQLRHALSSSGKYEHELCKEGSYPYIPMEDVKELYKAFLFVHFIREQRAAERFVDYEIVPELDLIDIGAGMGRIVMLAKFCGLKARGLEYSEEYVKLGRKQFELSEEELLVGDAFNIDEEYLQRFSFIYTYMLIASREKMTDLHISLFHKASPSAYLMEMLPSYYPMTVVHRIFPEKYEEALEKLFPEFSHPRFKVLSVDCA